MYIKESIVATDYSHKYLENKINLQVQKFQ